MENYFHLELEPRAINQISVLGLAHCGDAVFELLVARIARIISPPVPKLAKSTNGRRIPC